MLGRNHLPLLAAVIATLALVSLTGVASNPLGDEEARDLIADVATEPHMATASQTSSAEAPEGLQAKPDHPFWTVMEGAYESPARAADAMTHDEDANGVMDYLDRWSTMAEATGHDQTPVEILAWYAGDPGEAERQQMIERTEVRHAETVPGLDALFLVVDAGPAADLVHADGVEELAWAPRADVQGHDGEPGRVGPGQHADSSQVSYLNASEAWRMGALGQNVTLGMIDTGIDADAEAFRGKEIAWLDLVNGEDEPFDPDGHGTQMAARATGIHSEHSDGGIAPEADLAVARIFDEEGATISDYARALQWLQDEEDVDAVLLAFSLRGPRIGGFPVSFQAPMNGGDDDELGWDRLTQPVAQQKPTVAAAGNVDARVYDTSGRYFTVGGTLGLLSIHSSLPAGINGVNQVGSPGYTCEAITVGWVNDWRVSQPRSAVGPGRATGDVGGPCPITPDIAMSGGINEATSDAAAYAAGAVSVLLSHQPGLEATEAADTLTDTGQPTRIKSGGAQAPRPNTATGWGVPNLEEAIRTTEAAEPRITSVEHVCSSDGCRIDVVTNAEARVEVRENGSVIASSNGFFHELVSPPMEAAVIDATGDDWSDEKTLPEARETDDERRSVTLYGQVHDNDPARTDHLDLRTWGPSHTSFPVQMEPEPVGPDVVGGDLAPPAPGSLQLGPIATAYVHLSLFSTGTHHAQGAITLNVTARLMDAHGVLGEDHERAIITTVGLPFAEVAQRVEVPMDLDRRVTAADGDLRLEIDWSIVGDAPTNPLVVMWARHDSGFGVETEVEGLSRTSEQALQVNNETLLARGDLSTAFGPSFLSYFGDDWRTPLGIRSSGFGGDLQETTHFSPAQGEYVTLLHDPTGGEGNLSLTAGTRQTPTITHTVSASLSPADGSINLTVDHPEEVFSEEPIPITVRTDEPLEEPPFLVSERFFEPIELDQVDATTWTTTLPGFPDGSRSAGEHEMTVVVGPKTRTATVTVVDAYSPNLFFGSALLDVVPLPGEEMLVTWDEDRVKEDNGLKAIDVHVGDEVHTRPPESPVVVPLPSDEPSKIFARFVDVNDRVGEATIVHRAQGIADTSVSLEPSDGDTATHPVELAGTLGPVDSRPSGGIVAAESEFCSGGSQSNGFPCTATAVAEPGVVTFQLSDFPYIVAPNPVTPGSSEPSLMRMELWDDEGEKNAIFALHRASPQLRPGAPVPGVSIDAGAWVASESNTLVVEVPSHQINGTIEDARFEFISVPSVTQPQPLAATDREVQPMPEPPKTEAEGSLEEGWVTQSAGHLIVGLRAFEPLDGAPANLTVDLVRGDQPASLEASVALGAGSLEGPGHITSGTRTHIVRLPVLSLLGESSEATVAAVRVDVDGHAPGTLMWKGPAILDLSHLDTATGDPQGPCPAVHRGLVAPWGILASTQLAYETCQETVTFQIEATQHEVNFGRQNPGNLTETTRHTIVNAAGRTASAPTYFTTSTFGGGWVGTTGGRGMLTSHVLGDTIAYGTDGTEWDYNLTLDAVEIEPPEVQSSQVTETHRVELGAEAPFTAINRGPSVPYLNVSGPDFEQTVPAPGGLVDVQLPVDGDGHVEVPLQIEARGAGGALVEDNRTITLNHAPQVEAQLVSQEPRSLEAVNFEANVIDSDGDSADIEWFHDGEVVDTGTTADWIPQVPGEHEIRVQAEDAWAVGEDTIIVDVANRAPEAAIDPHDDTIERNTRITLGADASDADGRIEQTTWLVEGEQVAHGLEFEQTWTEPGLHNLTFSVEDDRGALTTAATTLNVTNSPPTITSDEDLRVNTTTLLPVEVLIETSDEENDTLDAEIREGPEDARVDDNADGFAFNWTPQRPGITNVTIAITDGADETLVNLTIDAANRDPSIEAIHVPRDPLTLVTVEADADAVDPDGTIEQWRWYLDGERIATTPTTDVQLFTPGNHSLKLEVTDDAGARATRTLGLNASNRAPSVSMTVDHARPAPPVAGEPVTITAIGEDEDGPDPSLELSVNDTVEAQARGTATTTVTWPAGVHTADVTAEDDDGGLDHVSRTFDVRDNTPPEANFTAPQLGDPEPVQIVSRSEDPEKRPLDHTWVLDNQVHSSQSVLAWTEPDVGSHTVELTVRDPSGARDTLTDTLVVDDGLAIEGEVFEVGNEHFLFLQLDHLGADDVWGTLHVDWGPAGHLLWEDQQIVEREIHTVHLDPTVDGLPHEVHVQWDAQSAPSAPVQDPETVRWNTTYVDGAVDE